METQISKPSLPHQNGFSSFECPQNGEAKGGVNIRCYKRRFWMLFIFASVSMLSGMSFPQFASMSDVNMCFYGVPSEAINWTCLMFMVVYIVLVFPVSWMMRKAGLRTAVILGAICNTVSYAVQFATLTPDGFPFVMVTSFFGSLSNVFVLAIPPCLAAEWFPSKEISRACAMGVFGNQLGVALGFVIPTLMVTTDCEYKDLIAEGKKNYSISLTSVNAIVLLLIIFTFQNEPKCPPSIAQAEKKDIEESFLRSSLSMAKNVNFLLIFLMYGFNVGTYFALATLLNNLILRYFKDENQAVGWMGLLLIVTGLVGSIIAGYILDYTRRYKETTTSLCALALCSYIFFASFLVIKVLWLQFVTIGMLGFFLTSFLPVGFEYCIEVTYPESEITSAGLLNSSTMLFGILITEVTSYTLQNFGTLYAHTTLSVSLFIAAVISYIKRIFIYGKFHTDLFPKFFNITDSDENYNYEKKACKFKPPVSLRKITEEVKRMKLAVRPSSKFTFDKSDNDNSLNFYI